MRQELLCERKCLPNIQLISFPAFDLTLGFEFEMFNTARLSDCSIRIITNTMCDIFSCRCTVNCGNRKIKISLMRFNQTFPVSQWQTLYFQVCLSNSQDYGVNHTFFSSFHFQNIILDYWAILY
jgi:hypothetical protein